MTSDGTSYWAKNEISPYDGAASAMANPRSEGNTTILETPDVLLPADTPAFLTFYWGDGVAVSLLKPDTGVAENTTNGSDGISDLSLNLRQRHMDSACPTLRQEQPLLDTRAHRPGSLCRQACGLPLGLQVLRLHERPAELASTPHGRAPGR